MYSSRDFYSRYSKHYEQYSDAREKYLSAIDNLIASKSPRNVTIVDVGAGTGKRSQRLANILLARHLTLIDESEGMVSMLKKIPESVTLQLDISSPEFNAGEKFDLVMCLSNVLGHIIKKEGQERALSNLAAMLEVNGEIVLDINNRYNLARYGKNALKNILRDIVRPGHSNGKFHLKTKLGDSVAETEVYIFNPFEFKRLIKKAGLKIKGVTYVDYVSGKKARTFFGGQIFYRLSHD